MLSKYENFLIGQISLQVVIIIRELLVHEGHAYLLNNTEQTMFNSAPFIHGSAKLI